MKMTNKRMLAFVLALLMCLTILPAGALAAKPEVIEAPGIAVANDIKHVTIGDYEYDLDGNATVTKYKGTGATANVPSSVHHGSSDYNVTKIGAGAFSNNAVVTTVTIPSTVKTLGEGAFSNCTKLASVTIKGDINNCPDDPAPFDGAGSGLKVTFDSGVTKVPANILMNSNLKNVVIPKSAITIGASAFENCSSLTNVSFPGGNSLKTIGEEAFRGCKSLSSISLPKTCTSLGSNAFEDCRGLSSITIAGNINTSGSASDVFKRAGANSGAISVTFTSNVTTVSNIFETSSASNAPRITKVLFKGDAPAIYQNAFKNITATVKYNSSAAGWTTMAGGNYGGELEWDGVVGARIPTQPTDKTVNEGEKVTFKVVASGTELQYQWQRSTDDGKTWVNVSCTKASYSFTTTAAMDGYKYRCKVYNDVSEVTSKVVKLTVIAKPAFTTNPSNVTVKEGKTATFKVKATGGSLKYQWYYKEDGVNRWVKLQGETKATLKIKATAAHNQGKFRCKVTNPAGSKYSSSAILTVQSKPHISKQPSNKTGSKGGSVTFKVTAAGAVDYQWYYREAGSKTWKPVKYAWTNTLTVSGLKKSWNGRQYRCRITNSVGAVYTKAVKLTVK